MDTFWHKQEKSKPLFPDVEWNRPERRDLAGNLGLIGGHGLGFSAIAKSYQIVSPLVGQVRVLLPDALRPTIPASITEVVFAPSNPSGGLGAQALGLAKELADWANGLLLVGDAGKNSQTAVLYEELIKHSQAPTVLTRDTIDLIIGGAAEILNNQQVTIVASFAQLQKLFRAVYYPKVLTFRMQLAQLADSLHKFSITYPATICVFHDGNLLVARGGQVVSQAFETPMQVWDGQVASKIACYLLWSPEAPLAAASTAIN